MASFVEGDIRLIEFQHTFSLNHTEGKLLDHISSSYCSTVDSVRSAHSLHTRCAISKISMTNEQHEVSKMGCQRSVSRSSVNLGPIAANTNGVSITSAYSSDVYHSSSLLAAADSAGELCVSSRSISRLSTWQGME